MIPSIHCLALNVEGGSSSWGMFSLLASIPFVEQDGMETSTVATNYRNILRLNIYPAPFRAPSGNSRKCKIRQHLNAQHKIRHVLSFLSSVVC